jgi:hypothetical protein
MFYSFFMTSLIVFAHSTIYGLNYNWPLKKISHVSVNRRRNIYLHGRIAKQPHGTTSSEGHNSLTLSKKLSSYGQSGLLSYGLLNLCYYTIATLFAVRVKPLVVTEVLTTGESYRYAVSYLSRLCAYVWAGSQVTKPMRLWGAVALAPISEKVIASFQEKLGLKTRRTAFWCVVALLWLGAALFYGGILFTSYLQLIITK